MKKTQRSLRRRLVICQLLVVVFFAMLTMGNVLWQFYRQGEGEYDKYVAGTAQSVMALIEKRNNAPEQTIARLAALDDLIVYMVALEKTNAPPKDNALQTCVRVANQFGQEIYRTPGSAHLPLASQPLGNSRFSVINEQWRTHKLQSADGKFTVQFAQMHSMADSHLLGIIFSFIIVPTICFLPIAGLITWFAAARGLSPLDDFAAMISRRSQNDLKPLEPTTRYAETEPVVNEINSLLQKLDTTLKRERNFLADAAHELRTPLAVIQTQVHVLKHAASESEKNMASDELNIGIDRAASLIQKLLLTARVSDDNFAPRFEPVDLTAFVQERIAMLSSLAAKKQIEMELTAPARCYVTIDKETFISAIDNVIDNAIRYTSVGGAIMIEIESLPNSRVRLRVADNGAGIPAELHERVFERFYRVAGSEQAGSGLGLAIVKRVLALHGGDVALSPGLDQRGLAVDLTMPVGA